jgi:hypothetical protein
MGCTILPKLAARTKGEERACSKEPIRREKNGEGDWARGALGGQQGDGRVFNTKFSKALHA